MHSYSKFHTLPLTGISLILVGLSVLIKFAGTIWINNEIAQLTREYSEHIHTAVEIFTYFLWDLFLFQVM